MQDWIDWGLRLLATGAIGAIVFFLKRTLSQVEERQKSMETNIGTKLDSLRKDTIERCDRTDQQVEKLNDRINGIIRDLPLTYVMREDWMVANQNTDRKLNMILEQLMQLQKRKGTE